MNDIMNTAKTGLGVLLGPENSVAFHPVRGLPEKMLAGGRIRVEQDWFFHYLLKDDSSVRRQDRDVYAAAYTSADAIRAGDAWYQAFTQDVIDDKTYQSWRCRCWVSRSRTG